VGLDITAYSHMTPCAEHAPEGVEPNYDAAEEAGHVIIYNNPGVPNRLDGLTSRCQKPSGYGSREFCFRAGSYSGYNRWRRNLSVRMLGAEPEAVWGNPERFRGQPFVELINFSDCEGTIGPVVSKKLAADFQCNAGKAREVFDPADADSVWWVQHYEDWLIAFTLASRGGFVCFH